MLQDHPHAIHFKHIPYFGEGQPQPVYAVANYFGASVGLAKRGAIS